MELEAYSDVDRADVKLQLWQMLQGRVKRILEPLVDFLWSRKASQRKLELWWGVNLGEEGQKSFPGRRNFYLQRPVEGGTMASVKDWKGQAPAV